MYKFKSKAGADVIMLGPQGDQVLRLIGKTPAPQGIVAVAEQAAAIAALAQAVDADEAQFAAAVAEAVAAGEPPPRRAEVSLKQRAWPFLELLRYSLKADNDVVWGV
nr:DUF1840 domain-containing protein [Roseateles koreensis]